MKTSKQLKEERAEVSKQIDALNAIENRTEEQTTELRNLIAKEETLDNEVEAALEVEKRNAKIAAAAAGSKVSEKEEKEIRKFSFSKMAVEIGTGKGLTGLEEELVEESRSEAQKLSLPVTGVYLSDKIFSAITKEQRSTMITSTTTLGGNLIPLEKIGWFDALFAYSVLEKLGVIKLTGLSANADLPGFSVAVTSGWANGETGTQTPSNPTVVARQLRPKLLYGAVDISKQLLLQTNQSVDAMVMTDIMASMAQTLQLGVINGTGATGQPTGILGTSGIQSVAMGTNGGAISYAKTMDLWSAVAQANANLDNCKWLTNPKVFAKALQTPIDTGSGAMIVTYNGNFGGQEGTIAGYPVFKTSSVPSTLDKGSSTGVCSALLFGDFSQVVVGQFGGVDVVVDPFTNARTGTTSITVNQYVDVTVKQPAALGAIADITTG